MTSLDRDAVLERFSSGEHMRRIEIPGIDLSGTKLGGVDFQYANLAGVNFEKVEAAGSILKNSSLREAYLVGADLSNTNLESADLEGANLDNANLTGVNLSRANLEGASLVGADLTGARLTNASLVSTNLSGAILKNAVLSHAELGESQLVGASLVGANLSGANLSKANLEDADCQGAKLKDAVLVNVTGAAVNFTGASLIKADARRANFTKANFTNCDARYSVFAGATVSDSCFTGACVGGMIGTGAVVKGVTADWIDTSLKKDGSGKRSQGETANVLQEGGFQVPMATPAPAVLTPIPAADPANPTRYLLGPEDLLSNAEFEFKGRGKVEIDGHCDKCVFTLHSETHLVIGKSGILIGCQIRGPGRITVLGAFIEEHHQPGIIGPSEVRVTDVGVLASEIEQGETPTRFAFKKGSRLRLNVRGARGKNKSGGTK